MDIRTIFIMGAFLNGIFIIYLLVFWYLHRNEVQGILFFIWGQLLIFLGQLGVSFNFYVPDFFSIVLSNTMIIVGLNLLYISLYKCLKGKLKGVNLLIWFIPILTLIEKLIFTFLIDNFRIRNFFMNLFVLLIYALLIHILIIHHKQNSLPGYIMLISSIIQFLCSILRTSLAMTITASGLFTSGFVNSIIILISILATTAWPVGFVLLASHRLKERALKESLEKSVLLHELHHRSKNNMAVLASLLNLQRNFSDSKKVRFQLQMAEQRVLTMALIHKILYQSKELSRISLRDYIKELLELLYQTYNVNPKKILLHLDIEDLIISMECAVPLGLVLNELLSNIFIHAFPSGLGSVHFFVKKNNDKKIEIYIEDDGIGVSEEFDFFKENTLGLTSIVGLVKHQLAGKIEFIKSQGVACRIILAHSQCRSVL